MCVTVVGLDPPKRAAPKGDARSAGMKSGTDRTRAEPLGLGGKGGREGLKPLVRGVALTLHRLITNQRP